MCRLVVIDCAVIVKDFQQSLFRCESASGKIIYFFILFRFLRNVQILKLELFRLPRMSIERRDSTQL